MCSIFGFICLFGSVSNVLTLSALGCSSFVINSCELGLSLPFFVIHLNITVDYLLMLTIFHLQNVLIILD